MPGQLVSLSELAKLFGKHPRTVKGWVRQGCPCVTQGSQGAEWQFDAAAVLEWHQGLARRAALGETTGLTKDQLRQEKLAVEVELARYELAERRKLMIRVSDIEPVLARSKTAIRARLLAIPSKLAPILRPEAPVEAEAVLMAAICEALEELSYGEDGHVDASDARA